MAKRSLFSERTSYSAQLKETHTEIWQDSNSILQQVCQKLVDGSASLCVGER